MKAFPHEKFYSDHHSNDHNNGMDLRDYFAAKAMQAFITGAGFNKEPPLANDVTVLAYGFADAMMKARKNEGD